MATTTTNNYLAETVWLKDYLKDYVRASGFRKYMGKDGSSVITMDTSLKSGGETIRIPLIGQLRGAGVTGNTQLRGAEEVMGEFADQITAVYFRNGVTFHDADTLRSKLDLLGAARSRLMDWSATKLRNDIIGALTSINVKGATDANGNSIDTGVSYATANAGQKNGYLTANTDRILIGAGSGSAAYKTTGAGNWTNTLALVTANTDKASSATIDAAVAMARQTGVVSSFGVNPVMADPDKGEESYVYFCGPEQFRDFRSDTTIRDNTRYALEGKGLEGNNLFTGGDLFHAGVVIRQIPGLTVISGAGASGVDVGRGFLCGKQAVTIAYSQESKAVEDNYDYGAQKGVGVAEARGVKKTSFNGVNFGVVEVFTASPAATY